MVFFWWCLEPTHSWIEPDASWVPCSLMLTDLEMPPLLSVERGIWVSKNSWLFDIVNVVTRSGTWSSFCFILHRGWITLK
jgi:hypothetical protein